MPHDAKGRAIEPGDTVLVPFKVKSVHQTEDACNLDLETCATMPPEHQWHVAMSAINSRMVLRANEGDDTSFAVLHKGMGEMQIVEPEPSHYRDTTERRGSANYEDQ